MWIKIENVQMKICLTTISPKVLVWWRIASKKARKADILYTLRWRHNDHAGVSNHQPHGCLLNRLFRHRSKKTSKLRVTGLCAGNSPGPVNSPHKGTVTRKMFPFEDVTMKKWCNAPSATIFCAISVAILNYLISSKRINQNHLTTAILNDVIWS